MRRLAKRSRPARVKNLIVVSDTHCGSGIQGQSGCGSLSNRLLASVQRSSPRADTHRSSVEGDWLRAGRVLALFFHCGPSAVCGRIVAVVVNAFDRVLGRWPWPHVGKKALEGVTPRRADLNPAAAVARIEVAAGILASRNHPLPHSVFRRLTQSVGSVGGMARLPIDASAACNVAAAEGAGSDDVVAATVALAQPAHLFVSRSQRPLNRQPAKSLTTQVSAELHAERCKYRHVYQS